MKLSTHFRHIRKGALLLFVLTLLAGYSVHDALSHYTGEDVPGTAQQGGCNVGGAVSCHGSPAESTTGIHLFTPAKIIAGQTYKLTISVSNPNPEDVAAGFDVDIDTPAITGYGTWYEYFRYAPRYIWIYTVCMVYRTLDAAGV